MESCEHARGPGLKRVVQFTLVCCEMFGVLTKLTRGEGYQSSARAERERFTER